MQQACSGVPEPTEEEVAAYYEANRESFVTSPQVLAQHILVKTEGLDAADKVVGRAAAAIALDGGAVRVHGLLMSESAKAFLVEQGVPASADKMVPQILNRKKDGLCPLEDAVKGQDVPEKMVKSIRARIKKLMSNPERTKKDK